MQKSLRAAVEINTCHQGGSRFRASRADATCHPDLINASFGIRRSPRPDHPLNSPRSFPNNEHLGY
eukprot:894321-Pleurochrysis_carterae.AAC.1